MKNNNFYLPEIVGKGYGKFWYDKSRYRVLKGGKGSKKSATTSLNMIYRLMKYEGSNLLVVRAVFNTHRDSTFAQLKWAQEKLGVSHLWQNTVSPMEMTYKPTGQKILFRGFDDVLKLASTTVSTGYLCWVWIEEAFEIESEDDFEKLDLSVPRGNISDNLFKQTTITFNPWNEGHWLKKRFFDNTLNNASTYTTNYLCNEFLDDTDRDVFEKLKQTNYRKYAVAGLGEWGVAEGLVFENFEMRSFDKNALGKADNTEWQYRHFFGLDYGYTNDPTAFIAFAVNTVNKDIYIYDEHYETKMLNCDIANMIKEKGFAKERIRADCAEPKSNADLRRLGITRIMPSIKGRDSVLNGIENITGGDEITYFLTHTENIIYCYISNYSIWKLDYTKKSEYSGQLEPWEKISLSESYIPLVMTHCKASKTNGNLEYKGTQFESFNTLCHSFRMIFSTVNIAGLNNGTIDAEYPLLPLDALSTFENVTVKAKHTTINGSLTEHNVKFSCSTNGGVFYENIEKTPSDNLYMFVKVQRKNIVVGFSAIKNSQEPKKLSEGDFVEDNLEIAVIIPSTQKLPLKNVFNMQDAVWFGGASEGVYGGSRLFLGANTNKKSLLVWSDINNPLYFPENCYAYVGDDISAVTAFGRQEDKLIIFKENEIYYTYYVYSGDISADDLISQNVVDYQANAVCFPIMLLNSFVGCDCPKSIQMCRNRLVWANSEGKVYTLCRINQYDEHTIYEISEMIRPKLKQYKDKIKEATSADFAGHYILFLGDCAFVADYNSYGYQYIYSYSKTDDANALLPWYYWDFSFLRNTENTDEYKGASVCMLGDNLLMRAFFNSSDSEKSSFVSFTMQEDGLNNADVIFNNDHSSRSLKTYENNIYSFAKTKLFELGNGIYTINADGVDLKTGINDGLQIKVKFICEHGEETVIISNQKYKSKEINLDFIKPKRVYPTMKSILKFGISLECEGQLLIDGLTIHYRLLGGAK